jgi:hypothetical protein
MLTGFAAAWPLIKRFWWLVPLIGMMFAILIMKANLAHKDEVITTANAKNADLTKANADSKRQIDNFAAQRIDNDAIAAAIVVKQGTNTVREINTRTIIEKAGKDDAQVATWNNTSVPVSVRRALQTNRPDAKPR